MPSHQLENITWGMSEKQDGQMKFVGHELESLANRKKYFESINVDPAQVVMAGLVHGQEIKVVTGDDRGKFLPETDGLLTNTTDVFLSVTAADCLPIYYIDQKHHAIGLAHAGWKSVLNEMAGQMMQAMHSFFGTEPVDLEVYIGPHIRHYKVLKNRADLFTSFSSYVTQMGDEYQLDLSGIVKLQLTNSGVARVQISPECTHCETEKYFSYQRDKPEETQAMVAYIGIQS